MKDFSYGIVPLKKLKGKWHALMILHQKGHWAFPKGHLDPGETPHEGAKRELKEEVGLEVVSFFEIQPLKEHYFFKANGVLIEKQATYYVAKVKGKVVLQEEEVEDYKWLQVNLCEELATFKETKKLCRAVCKELEHL